MPQSKQINYVLVERFNELHFTLWAASRTTVLVHPVPWVSIPHYPNDGIPCFSHFDFAEFREITGFISVREKDYKRGVMAGGAGCRDNE